MTWDGCRQVGIGRIGVGMVTVVTRPCLVSDLPPTRPTLTLLIKHDLDAPVYILLPSTRLDSCNRHRKVSNTLPEPDRSRPTRTAIPLLFPIRRVPFFSGLLGLVPCALAFPCSGARSH